MKHVNIKGTLLAGGKKSHVDMDGYVINKLFYPDISNKRKFYNVSYCHRTWTCGILVSHIEDLEDD